VGFARRFADQPAWELLLPRICHFPRFVDTRAFIWQILKPKRAAIQSKAGAGR
jgi:hypothetical protein